MRKEVIKAGDKYNRLTAIQFDHMDWHGNAYWLFHCSCGKEKVIRVQSVISSVTVSCGCWRKERMTTHGLRYSKEYSSWANMKDRCYNKNNPKYKDWGGRGITICKSWLKFENFFKDMGRRPSLEYSIDRIDNNKGYSLENCRWATVKEQANNTRSNRLLTYKGTTQDIAQWADETNIKYNTLYMRIRRNWSIEKALTK